MTFAEKPANDVFELIVPRESPWVLEVDGFVFDRLTDAVNHSASTGSVIYCRPRKKAANQ